MPGHTATVVTGSIGGRVAVVVIGSLLDHGRANATPAASPTATHSAAPVLTSVEQRFVKDATAKFQAPTNYVVKWRYSCASFGLPGNFIIDGDGGADMNGASVNERGTGGHVTAVHLVGEGRELNQRERTGHLNCQEPAAVTRYLLVPRLPRLGDLGSGLRLGRGRGRRPAVKATVS